MTWTLSFKGIQAQPTKSAVTILYVVHLTQVGLLDLAISFTINTSLSRAVNEPGIKNAATKEDRSRYFNGGFLILAPSEATYKMLLRRKSEAYNLPFVEQDLLNRIFKEVWFPISQKYNLMHCYKQKVIGE